MDCETALLCLSVICLLHIRYSQNTESLRGVWCFGVLGLERPAVFGVLVFWAGWQRRCFGVWCFGPAGSGGVLVFGVSAHPLKTLQGVESFLLFMAEIATYLRCPRVRSVRGCLWAPTAHRASPSRAKSLCLTLYKNLPTWRVEA